MNKVFEIELPLQIERPRKRPKVVRGSAKAVVDMSPIVTVLCPTLNQYRDLPRFAKMAAAKEIDARIAAALPLHPAAHWGGRRELVKHGKQTRRTSVGGSRRHVRVTRFSSRQPDEISIDAAGAKIALDRLVAADVLGGDSKAWIEREARWERAKPGRGFLRIEVFDLDHASTPA